VLRLLSVEHCRQTEQAGCLAACVQMALQHIGISQSQAHLNRLFGLMPEGTPSSRVQRLGAFGVDVVYASGDEIVLREAVDRGIPPIIFVDTGDLPYWAIRLRHAVLMVGYNEKNVYLNDPDQATAPVTASWGDLMLAWSEFDYKYALILSKQ
jgi:ABC-type bacteriocin/lantibiotic exporter with double-glycine peptidase domain